MTFEEYEEKHLHDLNHEARRLVRMGWNARGQHEDSIPHASLEVMGNIQVDEGGELQTYYRALVITFDTNEDIRAAIAAEKCTFGFKE